MRFKQWLSEQLAQTPSIAAPSANPTGDTRTLQTALQSTLQDPSIPNIVTGTGNNPNQMVNKIIPVAQNIMKRNPTTSNMNVTPMDVAKAAMPQLQMPKPQMQNGPKAPGTQPLS